MLLPAKSLQGHCRRSGANISPWSPRSEAKSAALLKLMAEVDPAIPVIFLDTGWLFEETLTYRDALIARLGLRDVRSIKPLEQALSPEDPERALWFSDPDTCCRIRKVEPLSRALAPFKAWINGRKRFQGGVRVDIPVVEEDGVRLKFNPFAKVSREQLEAIYRTSKLPPHPLVAKGFLSVGCMPCTSQPRRAKTCAPAAGVAPPKPNAASIRTRVHRPEFTAPSLPVAPRTAKIMARRSPFSHGWYATTPTTDGSGQDCNRFAADRGLGQ